MTEDTEDQEKDGRRTLKRTCGKRMQITEERGRRTEKGGKICLIHTPKWPVNALLAISTLSS